MTYLNLDVSLISYGEKSFKLIMLDSLTPQIIVVLCNNMYQVASGMFAQVLTYRGILFCPSTSLELSRMP